MNVYTDDVMYYRWNPDKQRWEFRSVDVWKWSATAQHKGEVEGLVLITKQYAKYDGEWRIVSYENTKTEPVVP